VSAFMKEVVDKERSDKLIRRDILDKKLRAYKTQLLEKERMKFELDEMSFVLGNREIVQIQGQIADRQKMAMEARRAA